MAQDQVIAITQVRAVLLLPQRHNQVTTMFVGLLAAFAFKTKLVSVLHAGPNFDLFVGLGHEVLRLAVLKQHVASKLNCLLTAVEELFECAFAFNIEVSRMCLIPLSDCILVKIALNFFDQLDLLAIRVKRHNERVIRTNKVFEQLKRVATKLVRLDAIRCLVTVLEDGLAKAVVNFTKLS